ncbi:hypothetical protein [Nocardia cyriacigeorgica]|nr:hypothetical protein [Nocardia cyriacigeorgica]
MTVAAGAGDELDPEPAPVERDLDPRFTADAAPASYVEAEIVDPETDSPR